MVMRWILPLLLLSCVVFCGCGSADDSNAQLAQVVIYTSVDEPYARQILQTFEKETGIRVTLVTDAEATKSVGLAERLRAERDNPQADVWWGNEVFHTISLANEKLLDSYASPAAEGIPKLFRGSEDRWTGTALRARVIAVSSQSSFAPRGLDDLINPSLKDKIAMARTTAGTTGGHVASLYVLWGENKADAYFAALRQNGVKLLGGNSHVADGIGQGTYLAGLTDNDDVAAAKREGGHLTLVLPDQETFGTLTIPTTVGLVAGAKNAEPAKKLIDYLLSPAVEQKLIELNFAAYSVRATEGERAIKSMEVDYAAVAAALPQAVRRATAILEGRDE